MTPHLNSSPLGTREKGPECWRCTGLKCHGISVPFRGRIPRGYCESHLKMPGLGRDAVLFPLASATFIVSIGNTSNVPAPHTL